MKPLLVVSFILILLVGVFVFFKFRTPEITNYPSNGTTIVAFGDSLVFGTGSTKGNDFVSRLSKEIGEPIVNLGVPGDTTALALARVDSVTALKPKVVLLLVGGNDYLRQIDQVDTQKNIGLIIEKIHASGAVVVLLGVRGGLLTDRFDSMFEDLADTYHTAFVPNVLKGLITNQKFMFDAVHPNDAGYALIAEKILPVLKEVIR